MTAFSKLLPENFGYIIFAGTGSILVNMWLAIQVGKARKQYGVKCPQMYSDDNNLFNCVQRAHQNYLENYPQFLFLLVTGGLRYPRITAGCGLVYLLSRVVYAMGYYTGDPTKRSRGAFGYIAQLIMLGSTIAFGMEQLGWIQPIGS